MTSSTTEIFAREPVHGAHRAPGETAAGTRSRHRPRVTLLGGGVFSLVLAVLLPVFVYPRLARLPADPQVEQVQTATDAEALVPDLDVPAGARVVKGADVRISTYVSGPKDQDTGDSVVWLLATRVSVGGHGLLNARVERVSMNPRTAQPTNCCGDSLITEAGDRSGERLIHSGYLTFPFDTQKQSYPIWDIQLRTTREARFEGEERRLGMRVYKFVAENSWTETGSQDLPGALFGLPDASVHATAEYADKRTMWVEPASGGTVDMVETVGQRFRYRGRTLTAMSADLVSAPLPGDTLDQLRTGATVLPWLRGRGSVVLVFLAVLLIGLAWLLPRRDADR